MPRHRPTCLLRLTLIATLGMGQAAAQERDRPGRFDYYVLVLGWSPSYCAAEGNRRHDRQCDAEKPRGFILHGALAAQWVVARLPDAAAPLGAASGV